MDYFSDVSTFNLIFWVYHVIWYTYPRINFRAMRYVYLKDICKTSKGIGETQFVLENLWIQKQPPEVFYKKGAFKNAWDLQLY